MYVFCFFVSLFLCFQGRLQWKICYQKVKQKAYYYRSESKILEKSLKTESAKSRGLRGNVSCVGAWVNFLRGLRRLRESKYFLRGSAFFVGHNFYVGCVSQIYFCVGQFFLRGSTCIY